MGVKSQHLLTPSYPEVLPTSKQFQKIKKFIVGTQKYTLPWPTPPPSYNPFDPKHVDILQDYYLECKIEPHPPLPFDSYVKVVTEIEKLYPNKKYFYYQRFKAMLCHWCRKLGHPSKWCDDIVDIDTLEFSSIRLLAEFVMQYPKHQLNIKYGKYSQLILELLEEFPALIRRRDKFWKDFGKVNPYSNESIYWAFGDYRRRDIGILWAMGSAKVYLLKLIMGYETKYCIELKNLRLDNHISWKASSEAALPIIHEYLSCGILRIIPESYAQVILPLALIIKPDKVRPVIDAKPINHYAVSMKFKPNNLTAVKQTIFKSARILTQDGRHAFFQLPVTKAQSLKQCIRFYYPPFGRFVVAAFTVEIFGSSTSCYRFHKMESQANNYFRAMGIQMNSYYDDSQFYAPDHPLFAAILGCFIKRVYYHLGRQLNEKKTDLLVGSYTAKFRGFLWDSRYFTYQPLDKTLISTHQLLDHIILSKNIEIPIHDLVSVMGKLSFIGNVINNMSILLSPIKDLMRLFHSQYSVDTVYQQKFVVEPSLVSHLIYLKKVLKKSYKRQFIIPHIDLEVVTDASERMAASYDSCNQIIIIPLPINIIDESSTMREIYGAKVAIINRLESCKGKNVRLLIDNLGSSTILMRNGSKLFKLNQIVYSLIKLCQDNDINLWVRWLRRDMRAIQFADDLSKSVEKDRWLFNRELLFFIIKTLKLPNIELDLLADNHNKICNKYYSRYKDGYSMGCNWMQYSYDKFIGYICYLNPPFRGDYLNLSIRQIIQKQINTYVVLPIWVSAPWYGLVKQYATYIVEIPEGSKYFTSPSYMTNRLTKKWNIMLVFFYFKIKMKPKYYKFIARTYSIIKAPGL